MWADVNELLSHATVEDVRRELEAQIRTMLSDGLRPSHLDHHMDFYYFRIEYFRLVMDLSRKYQLPMRVWRRRKYRLPFVSYNLSSLRGSGYVFPDTQMGLYCMKGPDQSAGARRRMYIDYLRSLMPGVHNIKLHVASQTPELEGIIGAHHASIRQIDHDVWTSEETRAVAREVGISFIGFRPLQRLQAEYQNLSRV